MAVILYVCEREGERLRNGTFCKSDGYVELEIIIGQWASLTRPASLGKIHKLFGLCKSLPGGFQG